MKKVLSHRKTKKPKIEKKTDMRKEKYANGDVYEGAWKKGNMHGKGKMKYANGVVYEGAWEKGNMHGKGKMTYACGAVYEGAWENSNMHGKGMMTFSDRAVYEGEWEKGDIHGKGKITYSDGDVYEGAWEKGEMHGKGKRVYADGVVYEGEWEEGEMHGRGRITHVNGAVYEGEWKEGLMNVLGKMVYNDGNIYNGEWREGLKSGLGKMVYNNGEVYEGYFKNDILIKGIKTKNTENSDRKIWAVRLVKEKRVENGVEKWVEKRVFEKFDETNAVHRQCFIIKWWIQSQNEVTSRPSQEIVVWNNIIKAEIMEKKDEDDIVYCPISASPYTGNVHSNGKDLNSDNLVLATDGYFYKKASLEKALNNNDQKSIFTNENCWFIKIDIAHFVCLFNQVKEVKKQVYHPKKNVAQKIN